MSLLRAGGAIVLLSGMNIDARVVTRGNVGNQGSPLLLGPQGGGATPPSANDSTSSSGRSGDDDPQDSNNNDDDDSDSDSDSVSTSTSTASVSTKASGISTTTSTSTSTSPSTSSSSSISTSRTKTSTISSNTISTSSPAHTSENRLIPPDPPKQPSSVRYLVPVFLLILITLVGFGYQKYRKRKKRRSRSSMAGKDFEKLMKNGNDPFLTSATTTDNSNPYRGWKEIPSKDDDEDDGIWDSRMDDDAPQIRFIDEEHNTVRLEGSRAPTAGVNGGLVRSGQFISASEKGWGWRESWNNFKSARGKDNRNHFNTMSDLEEGTGDIDGEEIDEKQTMKLVKSNKLSASITYTDILPATRGVSMGQHDYHEVAIEDELSLSSPREGQIRQLKDQLNSLTYQNEIPPTNTAPKKSSRLERNKSPNSKRQSKPIKTDIGVNQDSVMPEAPEWIRPRSVSPTNLSILSPPMQPHLFFHPSPIPNKRIEPSIISEYSENGTISTLPSTQNTPQPSPNPDPDTNVKMPRIPSTASGLAGIDSFSVVNSNKMPPSAGADKREKGYIPSGLNPVSNSPKKNKGISSPNKLNLTLKRSTALKNLSNPSSKKSSSTLSPDTIINRQKISKKSRVEKKELKARNEVEDILKASWSDRALISPPLGSPTNQGFADHLRSQGVPGMMSPGLEQGGNGIEQRLALLKGVDI
ncbi:hypothetical protein I203_107579 [Kwoniella mangroviensis CBS 8507]|uniref:hypothetical protein n=1 Tax=Kwoniella mangroviensis CBS 8507 TaxID=1296122 RepID=UPI00080D4DEE|nr:uncharacterized protein I203_02327 [Kwoniella mangroviensis CBS 8507]OCF68933.1 hypothetical protein I203_02327 [Kwoniella mangroviensis CBS 8507]